MQSVFCVALCKFPPLTVRSGWQLHLLCAEERIPVRTSGRLILFFCAFYLGADPRGLRPAPAWSTGSSPWSSPRRCCWLRSSRSCPPAKCRPHAGPGSPWWRIVLKQKGWTQNKLQWFRQLWRQFSQSVIISSTKLYSTPHRVMLLETTHNFPWRKRLMSLAYFWIQILENNIQ